METSLLLRKFCAVILLLCVKTEAQNVRPKFDSLLSFSDNTNVFAANLYKSLGSRGNLVVSPMSIFTSMSMTSVGSQGQTRSQILRALNLQTDSLTRNSPMAYIVNNFQNQEDDKVTLEMANFMWVPMGVSIKADFARTLQDVFQTRVRSADFTRAEDVRLLVNNRVSNATRGKIPQILPRGAVTPQTRLLLANAVYFKGSWVHPFDPRETRLEPFVFDAANSRSSLVPMMRTSDLFRAAVLDDLDAKALILPYEGSRYGLLLVLPNRYDGIRELENNIAKLNYTTTTLIQRMSHRDVNVTLPKFQIKFQTDISLALQRMGITDLFSDNADLSGLSSTALRNRLRASGFFHQATLEVNEGGSEASAASGLEITPLIGAFGSTGPIDFKADHPFLFFIVDEDNGNLPLFMGRVTNPSTEEIQNNEVEPSRSREQLPDNPNVFSANRNRPSNVQKVFQNPSRILRPNMEEIIFPQTRNEQFLNFQRVFSSPQAFRRNPTIQSRPLLLEDLFFSPSVHQVHNPVVFPDEEAPEELVEHLPRRTRQTESPKTAEETIELRGDKFWFKKPAIQELLIPINETKPQGVVPQSQKPPQQPLQPPRTTQGVPPQSQGAALQPQQPLQPPRTTQGVPPQFQGVPLQPQQPLQPPRTTQSEVNIFGGSGWSGSSAGPQHSVGGSPGFSPADFASYLLLPFKTGISDFNVPIPDFPPFPQGPNPGLIPSHPIVFPGLVTRIQEALRNRA